MRPVRDLVTNARAGGRLGRSARVGAFAVLLALGAAVSGCGPQQATTGGSAVPKVEAASSPENEMLKQHRFLGDQYLSSKLPEKAAAKYRKGLEIAPENADLWGLLGYALLENEETENAIKAYKRYVDLQPEDCDARASLGFAYLRHGLTNQATLEYERALALCPDDPNAFNNMGKAYLQAGEQIEAIEAFRRAIALNPDDILAWDTLARLYWERNLYPEAISAYEAILGHPNHGKDNQWIAWANDRLGYLYRWGGADDRAVNAYQRVLEANPNDAKMKRRATQGLAVAYDKSGQTDQAIGWYEKLVAENPEQPEYHYRLAELYIDVGRHREAVMQAKEGQTHDTGCGARAYCALGTAYEKQSNYQRAKRMFQQAANCNDPRFSAYAAKEVDRQDKLIKIQQLKQQKDKYGY